MIITAAQSDLLVGAIVALFTAITAYIYARQQALISQVRGHDAQLNGPTAARDARITALEVKGAGRISPTPPAWNQLNDPLSDGSLPSLRTQECGEEVAAMIIMWRHGVPISADALRSILRGPGGAALTTAADIAAMLSMCNVTATAHAAGWPEAQKTTRAETGAGRPVALLVSVPTGGWHWLCLYSSDDAAVHYIDPWGGMRLISTWSVLAGRYAGSFVATSGDPNT